MNLIQMFAESPKDVLEEFGCTRLYEPSEGWYDVVPVEHILGAVPLMPDYGTPRIPGRYSLCSLYVYCM